jgi:DNA-binding response OmpR family regulator
MTDAPHILVIDDEPDIVDLVAYNLRKDGFIVSTAPDGEEALRKINTEDFALIILDLMLPGIQGMELCRMLKKSPRTENLPIIMLTAKVEEIDRILGLETGADDYMTKPFGRELVARVKAVLKERPQKLKKKYHPHWGPCH